MRQPLRRDAAATETVPLSFEIGQTFNPYKLFTGAFIPDPVCKYRGISPGAKVIYGRLCRYAGKNGEAFPAVESLAFEVGISETQARTYLKELKAAEFIKSVVRTDHEGRQTSNSYQFLWHEAFTGAAGTIRWKPGVQDPAPSRVQKTEVPQGAVHCTRRESSPSEESQKEKNQNIRKPNATAHALCPTGQIGPPETNLKAAKLLPGNNDDETSKAREHFANPLTEFRARISERHEKVDIDELQIIIQTELSKNNNATMTDFLVLR